MTRMNPSRVGQGAQRGSAITESLLIVSFAAITLAAIPAIANYGLKRMQAAQGAKLLAWQRNVWLPEAPIVDATEALRGANGALIKTNAEVERDIQRHIFRDRTQAGMAIHADDIAEFTTAPITLERNTNSVSAKTSSVPLPSLLNAGDVVADGARVAQHALASNVITQSLGQFSFITGGYLRHDVQVTQSSPRFSLVPQMTMNEHVTMLTEAWNAGGTNREEKKIQGLVPTKMMDSVFYQQFRNSFSQAAYAIKQVYPAFDPAMLEFGLKPGDAAEKSTPLDRFERFPTSTAGGDAPVYGSEDAGGGADAVGGSVKDRFRYYRAFPPTPVVNSLP